MTTLSTLFNQGNADLIYLVELNALKLSDSSLEPLYFSNLPTYFSSKQFLPVIDTMPDLDIQANDTLDPAYLPTYGDLVLNISGAYKPDVANSIAWNLLLYKESYSFAGQAITIKVGEPGDDYGDFSLVFTGWVGNVSWNDAQLTVTIYGKLESLKTKYPDYELPESEQVAEDSWGESVPIILGTVKNLTPVLISTEELGLWPNKYALACHVIYALDAVYFNQSDLYPPTSEIHYHYEQKDVSPPSKDSIYGGSATMKTFGPYTGTALKRDWLIRITSITTPNSAGVSGSEVGLAIFQVSNDKGTTWSSDYLTWKLDTGTITVSPGVGSAVLAISGEYTGDTKRQYHIKVVRAGDIGDAAPPRVIFSDDDLATELPGIASQWTPIASAPGAMTVTESNPYDIVYVEITTGGYVGGAVRFRWSNDGQQTWTTNVSIPDTSEITLFAGFKIQFTAPGGAEDDYDAGDAGGCFLAIDVLDTDPISLNRGLSAAFSGIGFWTDLAHWVADPASLGAMTIASITEALDEALLEVVITTGGEVGGGLVKYKWQYDSGGWTTDQDIPNTDPIELFTGLSIQFSTAMSLDDYTVGDEWRNDPFYTPAFVVDDDWTWNFDEIPIPLGDGVSVQFFTGTGQDFYVGDEFAFILMSTLAIISTEYTDSIVLTVDMRGLINPETEVFSSLIGDIIESFLRMFPEWVDADFDLDSITAFNTAIPYEGGLAVTSPEDATETLNNLLTGIPAIFSVNFDNKFFLKEIVAPSGTPDLTLTDEQIMDLPEFDQDGKIAKRIYIKYNRNNTTANNFNLSEVSQERLSRLPKDYQQISRKDDSVTTNYPMAEDYEPMETSLILRDDAALLAEKDLALFKVPRITVKKQISLQAALLNVGDIVEVIRDVFGQESGLLYMVKGKSLNFTERSAEITLWR